MGVWISGFFGSGKSHFLKILSYLLGNKRIGDKHALDYSKIQGRFDTRLSLSSANVDVVIKKKILDKTEIAAQSLRLLYEQKAMIIKNLIVFNDGVEKKLYSSAEDFTAVYPLCLISSICWRVF